MSIKFLKDLPVMVNEGVITQEDQDRILLWYREKKEEKPNRLFILLGILGALLVGLGIILLLAHNWDNFGKITKTGLAFLPLVISQILVSYALYRKSELWIESSATLLFFSVGTAISLISQIYHIPGNINNFLLTWILLCMPLIYLLKSKALILLHLAFSTWWVVAAGYGYRSEIPWFFLLFSGWLVPAYYNFLRDKKESNMLTVLDWLLPASLTIALGTFIKSNESLGFLMYMLLFGVFYQWGCFERFKKNTVLQNGFLVSGLLGMIVLLLITSFKDVWKEVASEGIQGGVETYSALVLLLLSILVFIKYIQNKEKLNLSHYAVFVFTAVFFVGEINTTLATIIINILTLSLGLYFVWTGARNLSFKKLNLGLLVITALIVCRFFDTDLSFVFRGILFIGLGIGFFTANYFLLNQKPGRS